MEIQERNSLLYRIIQGKISCKFLGNKYYICFPNIDILYEAQVLYDEIINDAKYEPWLKLDQCKGYLTYNGLWTPEMDGKLKSLTEDLEDVKVAIYKSFFNNAEYQKHKTKNAAIIEEISKLETVLHSLDYTTIEGFAAYEKDIFILQNTIIDSIGNKVLLDNIKDIGYFRTIKYENYITVAQYRELARTSPWSDYWGTHKAQNFSTRGVDLTDEQRNLLLYSNMYESISNHPEPPPKQVIEDDDALDGWLITARREREKEKKDSGISKLMGIHDGAQEVFIPAQNFEDIKKINELNTVEGKNIKLQRTAAIKAQGEVTDAKLPDKQVEINRMTMDNIAKRN